MIPVDPDVIARNIRVIWNVTENKGEKHVLIMAIASLQYVFTVSDDEFDGDDFTHKCGFQRGELS